MKTRLVQPLAPPSEELYLGHWPLAGLLRQVHSVTNLSSRDGWAQTLQTSFVNQDLADRYGVSKDDFPVYRLFKKGAELAAPGGRLSCSLFVWCFSSFFL